MKKIVSLFLAISLVFSFSSVAFAAEGEENGYNGDPVVIVRGIDFAGLIREDGSKALAFSLPDLLAFIGDFAKGTLKGQDAAFEDALIAFCQKLFAPVSSDKEGKSLYADVHMKTYPYAAGQIEFDEDWVDGEGGLARSAVEKFGGENVYFFTYDWRKSPLVLSDELNEFITMVKKNTGKEKVDIGACSMGGLVTTAYMYEYGTDSIDSLVYFSAAHNGTDIVGAALTGDIYTTGDYLSNYLSNMAKDSYVLKALISAVDCMGLFDCVADFLNGFIEKNIDRIYDELMRDCFGTSLGLWGLCCDKDFDSGVEYLFGKCKDEYPAVISELANIREYLYSTDTVIENAYKDGVKISFVSHYNNMLLPIYDETVCQSDSVVESYLTSNGGTFARFGEVLTDEYLASVDEKYISPDKMVDASTCRYVDTTWYIKDAPHVGCKLGSDHAEFGLWLLSRDTQPTVETDSAYPRFTAVDKDLNFIK